MMRISDYVLKKKKKAGKKIIIDITNVNLSILTLPCSRVPSMYKMGVYCQPCDRWALLLLEILLGFMS